MGPNTALLWCVCFFLLLGLVGAARGVIREGVFDDQILRGSCRFPFKWEGTWFQSGYRQHITIHDDIIDKKGRCIESQGDKFLVYEENEDCYRCVAFHEKHINVLQYKETHCNGPDTLRKLCSRISGDALLYSMFRVNAEPIVCPFQGPFTFSYNRGKGECRFPVSNIDSCTEDSRIVFRYQACPDVESTESTEEELQCLAVWKEGSMKYLVGKVHHKHAKTDEEKFRCFVFEKSKEEEKEYLDYRLAQSGDATCNGLFSPAEGSRTMKLKKAASQSKCHFPPWVTAHHHWHTLDYQRSYKFDHRNITLKVTNASVGGDGLEMRVLCTQIREISNYKAHLVTHVTTGCKSGYVCMVFYRRDGHVIEVQQGPYTTRPQDACLPMEFNPSTLPFITLVTSSPETHQCPYLGKYSVRGVSKDGRRVRDACIEGFSSLLVGCTRPTKDTMEFQSACRSSDFMNYAYSCHGRWEVNGTNYLITTPLSRSSKGARRFCFIYRQQNEMLQFSSISSSCQRNISPGVSGTLAFNVTGNGHCVELSGSVRHSSGVTVFLCITVTLAMTWTIR